MENRFFIYKHKFVLECGEVLPEIKICYHISKEYPGNPSHSSPIPKSKARGERETGIQTAAEMQKTAGAANEKGGKTRVEKIPGTEPEKGVETGTPRKKVVWITHALTANSNPCEWWDTLVGEGKYLDPRKYTIVCANILGSCYGSTSPVTINPQTGKPYLLNFPKTTIRDIVACHELLREALGIKEIDLLIGGSVGGFQAIEWSIIRREVIKNLVLLACNARITPWGNAFNESQRMALYADSSFEAQEYDHSNGQIIIHGGKKGLATARSIALISYRSYLGYNISQHETSTETIWDQKAASYQQYQGKKLVNRFDPYSYLSMLNLTDSHNIGRGRGGVETALKMITARVVCIGIDSDALFPCQEQKHIAAHVSCGEYKEISSLFGHDGFLLEWQQIQAIIQEII